MKWPPGKSPFNHFMDEMRDQIAKRQREMMGYSWINNQIAKVKVPLRKFQPTNKPSAIVLKVWEDFNVSEAKQKGMRIHVAFWVANLDERKGFVGAYFFFANGVPLRDFNGKYHSKSGNVCVEGSFSIPLAPFTYNDYSLFMPYNELHMGPGNHSLKFNVGIWTEQYQLMGYSQWVPFTYNERSPQLA